MRQLVWTTLRKASCQQRRRQRGESQGEREKGHPSIAGEVPDLSLSACPHLLPRPSRAKSAWQRGSLNLRRKPLHRQCQERPEDTNICLASAPSCSNRALGVGLGAGCCGKEVNVSEGESVKEEQLLWGH